MRLIIVMRAKSAFTSLQASWTPLKEGLVTFVSMTLRRSDISHFCRPVAKQRKPKALGVVIDDVYD